jgi:hypothetical protein
MIEVEIVRLAVDLCWVSPATAAHTHVAADLCAEFLPAYNGCMHVHGDMCGNAAGHAESAWRQGDGERVPLSNPSKRGFRIGGLRILGNSLERLLESRF